MSQVIPVNLPIRFQSMRVPVQWRILSDDAEDDDLTFAATFTRSPVGHYDAWQKRNEFFRLKEGDNEGLLNFLNSVGVWDRPGPEDAGEGSDEDPYEFTQEGGVFVVAEQPWRFADDFWHMREHARIALSSKRLDVLGHFDLSTRFVRKQTGSYLLVCTVAFLDALFATVVLDHAEGARVLRCARPDCGIVFTANNRHKRKYCTWDCAHLVAVRKSRLTRK